MATLRELQKQLDDKSLDPSKLSRKQRLILDELIKRGDLKGPSMREVQAERGKAAQSIAREKSFYADPIAAALDAEDNPYFIKGRSTAELAGDVSASIAPYAAMRKKFMVLLNRVIFGKKAQVNFYNQQQKLQIDYQEGLN